jgi:hypothetical protein
MPGWEKPNPPLALPHQAPSILAISRGVRYAFFILSAAPSMIAATAFG